MQKDTSLTSILVIVFSLVLIILGVFFFVLIMIYIKKVKEKQIQALNNILIGQENERERLSRDLHDELGPTLSTIIFTIDRLKQTDNHFFENKNEAKDMLKDAINQIRNISHDLGSYSLKRNGLNYAINEFINNFKSSNLQIYYNSKVTDFNLKPEIEFHLYKIIQELIQNTLKHSEANLINLDLNILNNKLVLEFRDNGIGFAEDLNTISKGIGLKNIYTRVNMIKGKIDINGKNGFILRIELQYDNRC